MPFRDIIGHTRVLELLARSIELQSLPPSQLFAGPSGVGKRLAALSVAQALNCLQPVPFPVIAATGTASGRDGCGRCTSCTRIARRVHPDVVWLEPDEAGAIGIDAVRAVLDQVAYRPFEARRRVVIADEADALGTAAQSALLKTLEEPPPATVFILVSSRPDALLPTVLSRCPRLRFRPLTIVELAKALADRGYAEAEAHAVAAISDGSLGRALEARAGDLLEARQLAGEVLAKVARTANARDRLEQAKVLTAKRGGSAASDRDQLSAYLRAMASLLRDVELLATGADERALANADVQGDLDRLRDAYAGGRSREAFVAVDRAIAALDRNASAKIVADWLVLQI